MITMGRTIAQIREDFARGDAIRDEGLPLPEDVQRFEDLPYGPHPENLLDVYCPAGTETPLPTIISFHGGGWVYGSKKVYSHYCMRLARRGFTVVNFDYRLAPESKYPAPLEDMCNVAKWVLDNAGSYFIDTNNLFMVGDSAGGQMAFQFLALLTNPKFAKLFSVKAPEGFRINACGLNCGCYFMPISRLVSPKRAGAMFEAYYPEDYMSVVPQFKVNKYVTNQFPPAFVMTAQNDYLKMMAAPLHKLLKRRGVETALHIYGTKEQKEIGHCFHLNSRSELADKCNDEQCAFLRNYIR